MNKVYVLADFSRVASAEAPVAMQQAGEGL